MRPLARSLAERLIDAFELYVNAIRQPGEQPDEAIESHAARLPRALAWLTVDARRILGKSQAASHEVHDRKAAS
jgi:hypothetical protein